MLDICFGIGYNSKSAIEKFSKLKLQNKTLEIDAIEINKELIFLAPFIKVPQYEKFINETIYSSLKDEFSDEFLDFAKKAFQNKKYEQFLDFSLLEYAKNKEPAFLHNIYYQYISKRNKNRLKVNHINKVFLNFYCQDARIFSLNNRKKYDLIFLDAFTALKSPCLWTFEFLKNLKHFLNNNGKIITYSCSSAVRHALLQLGFHLGNLKETNSDEKSFGTIASLEKTEIKYPISEFEKGLLKTNAGIMFHDKNLNLSDEEILKNREFYGKKYKIQSTSSYIKQKRRENGSL